VGQVAFQNTTIDLSTVAQPLREQHARFLRKHKDVLVTGWAVRWFKNFPTVTASTNSSRRNRFAPTDFMSA
jgi:hypothetical protein